MPGTKLGHPKSGLRREDREVSKGQRRWMAQVEEAVPAQMCLAERSQQEHSTGLDGLAWVSQFPNFKTPARKAGRVNDQS
jgi:hypothetical protein